ncbi:unnamed protein product [Symbiodinium sp. CCMP2592]|nr:unnamed protein product [Symbiodinium sp. CCMP2592]
MAFWRDVYFGGKRGGRRSRGEVNWGPQQVQVRPGFGVRYGEPTGTDVPLPVEIPPRPPGVLAAGAPVTVGPRPAVMPAAPPVAEEAAPADNVPAEAPQAPAAPGPASGSRSSSSAELPASAEPTASAAGAGAAVAPVAAVAAAEHGHVPAGPAPAPARADDDSWRAPASAAGAGAAVAPVAAVAAAEHGHVPAGPAPAPARADDDSWRAPVLASTVEKEVPLLNGWRWIRLSDGVEYFEHQYGQVISFKRPLSFPFVIRRDQPEGQGDLSPWELWTMWLQPEQKWWYNPQSKHSAPFETFADALALARERLYERLRTKRVHEDAKAMEELVRRRRAREKGFF